MAGADRRRGVLKSLVGAALSASLATATPVPALADSPAAGEWKVPMNGAIIQLYDCADKLCGRVLSSDDLNARPFIKDSRNSNPALRDRYVKGMTFLEGFTGGPPLWKNGHVYNPGDGHTYYGEIRLASPDALKLAGCIVFIIHLCRSQTWTRVKPAP